VNTREFLSLMHRSYPDIPVINAHASDDWIEV